MIPLSIVFFLLPCFRASHLLAESLRRKLWHSLCLDMDCQKPHETQSKLLVSVFLLTNSNLGNLGQVDIPFKRTQKWVLCQPAGLMFYFPPTLHIDRRGWAAGYEPNVHRHALDAPSLGWLLFSIVHNIGTILMPRSFDPVCGLGSS